jgi:hypothetical protein
MAVLSVAKYLAEMPLLKVGEELLSRTPAANR